MIETYEELKALPDETPIRDVAGVVWERADLAAQYAKEYGAYTVLPAVQLIPATISREKLSQTAAALCLSQMNRTGESIVSINQDDLTAALAVLGIEVGDE